MRKKLELLSQVEAIMPEYGDQGENACYIVFSKGNHQFIDMRVDKLLRAALRHLNADLQSKRVWANNLLNKRHLNPIVVNLSTLLVPIKTRQPIGSKDGSYTYVKYQSIQSFDENNILLRSGVEIPYCSSTHTVRKKLRDAKYLDFVYKEELKREYEAYMASTKQDEHPIDETKRFTF